MCMKNRIRANLVPCPLLDNFAATETVRKRPHLEALLTCTPSASVRFPASVISDGKSSADPAGADGHKFPRHFLSSFSATTAEKTAAGVAGNCA